jgi:U3 small nucleolar RNA-associated protein 14
MDELKEDEEFFNRFLVRNDENKKDFFESTQEKKQDPDFLSGWGSWAGDTKAINTKEFLQKKRYQQRQEMAERNTTSTVPSNVKINNSFDKKVISLINFSSQII